VVLPENERPSRLIGELLALAACIAVCAVRLMWLPHARSTPMGSIHEILAERAGDADVAVAAGRGGARPDDRPGESEERGGDVAATTSTRSVERARKGRS